MKPTRATVVLSLGVVILAIALFGLTPRPVPSANRQPALPSSPEQPILSRDDAVHAIAVIPEPEPSGDAASGDCCDGRIDPVSSSTVKPAFASLAAKLKVTELDLCRVELPSEMQDELQVSVVIDGAPATLLLRKHSVRGENFRLIEQRPDGTFRDLPVPEVSTYNGEIAEDQDASVHVIFTPDGMSGRIDSISAPSRIIRPLAAADARAFADQAPQGNGAVHAVFPERADIEREVPAYRIASAERQHQMNLAAKAEPGINVAETGDGSASSALVPRAPGPTGITVKQAEMGFDVAYSFYSGRCGSNPATVATTIEDWMNNTHNPTILPAALVEHVIGTVMIRTTAASDPYNGMGDAYTLLPFFKTLWNGGNASYPRPSTTHDLATCVLNQGIGVTGLANVGVVGTSSKYNVCTAASGLGFWKSGLRHEVGHNWSLNHGDGCGEPTTWWDTGMGIMCGGYHDRLNTLEASKMLSHRNSRSAGVLKDLGAYPAAQKIAPYCPQDVSYTTTVGGANLTLDVLANDYDANGDTFTIEGTKKKADANAASQVPPTPYATTLGGSVIRSIGTGPGGRDVLIYTPPTTGAGGNDEFHYTVRDTTGKGAWGFATVTLGASITPTQPKPINPASYLADSIIQWNNELQGDQSWQYGQRPAGTSQFNLLPAHRSETFPLGGDATVWAASASNRPFIGQNAACPQSSADAVRRWTSTYTGPAVVEIDLMRLETSGNGQTIILEKNGVSLYSVTLSNSITNRIANVPVTVATGDHLDLVVSAIGDQANDWTSTHMRVIRGDYNLADPTFLFHLPLDESGYDADSRRLRVGDASGNNRHGSLQNTTPTLVWLPGALSNCAYFDGVDDQVVLDDSNIGDGATELTISLWLRPETKAANEGMITSISPSDASYCGMLLSGSGIGFPVEFRAKGSRLTGPDDTGPVNRWTHAVGTWKAGQFQRLYLDGVEVAGITTGVPTGTLDIDLWKIGRDRNQANRYFHGNLDDIAVWNRALDSSEIRAMNIRGREAHELDGTSEFLTITPSPVPATSTELTLSAWVKPVTKGANKGIITSDPNANYFALLFSGNGVGNPLESRAMSQSLLGGDSSGPVGQWSHAVSVWKSGQIQKLYIDGIEESSSASPSSGTANSADWIVGRDRLISERFFNGQLGDLVIINRALSSGEVSQLTGSGQTTDDARHGSFARSGRVGGISATSGDLREGSGIFALGGVGVGIGGTADDFEFLSRPRPGDGAITMRMAANKLAAPAANNGLMFRESLAAGSKFVFLTTDASGALSIKMRSTTNGAASTLGASPIVAPLGTWLRLARNGNTFTASSSTNGSVFSTLDKVNMTLANDIHAGLAMAANSASVQSVTQADRFSIGDLPLMVDADADQMADTYELQYFGTLRTSDGTQDSDGDGISDYYESLAGTNPQDPKSAFRITESPTIQPGGNIQLKWQAVAGKTYRIMRSPNLSAPWTPVATGVPAVIPETIHMVPMSGDRAFYRIEVESASP